MMTYTTYSFHKFWVMNICRLRREVSDKGWDEKSVMRYGTGTRNNMGTSIGPGYLFGG